MVLVVDQYPPFVFTWTREEWHHDDDSAGALVCESGVWFLNGSRLETKVTMSPIVRSRRV